MSFNSLEFLLFLPAVVLLYWLLPHKARWILLLAASYIFYMSWNVWLIGLILAVTVTAYVAGIAIDRADNRKAKKVWLIVTLIVCLGLLIFFKYINFILESAVGVIRLFDAGQEDIALNVILPVEFPFTLFRPYLTSSTFIAGSSRRKDISDILPYTFRISRSLSRGRSKGLRTCCRS